MARPETRAAVEKLLGYYEESKRLHIERTGKALKEYKPTETDRLAELFESVWPLASSGVAFLADLLHVLVWSQCLGNANHRTSVLFLQAFLDSVGIPFPSYGENAAARERFSISLEAYSDRSHRLLDRQSEFGFGPAQLEAKHRTITEEWIREAIGDQSRVAMTVGPQRLMTFIS